MTARHIISEDAGLSYGLQPAFTTTTNTYTAMRAEGIKFTPSINMIPVAYMKPEDVRGPDADIVGGYGGTLTFNIPVRSGAGAGSPFMALAGYMGCTKHTFTKATAHVTGGTSTTVTISTANAAAHGYATTSVGACVALGLTTSTTTLRFITRVSVATSVFTMTVNQAWSSNPSAGMDLLAIDTVVPATGEPSKYISFKNYLGQGATDRLLWQTNGSAGTWKLNSTDAGAIPMATFDYQVDNWADSETSASTAVKAADGFNPAKPVLGDALYLEGTQTDVKSIEFDPGLKLIPLSSTYGTHGRTGWYYVGDDPKVNFTPYHDQSLITAWEAATQKAVMFESLSGATGWALFLPETQITAYDLQDDEGLMRAALTLKAIDPGKNADSVNYPRWAFAVTR